MESLKATFDDISKELEALLGPIIHYGNVLPTYRGIVSKINYLTFLLLLFNTNAKFF